MTEQDEFKTRNSRLETLPSSVDQELGYYSLALAREYQAALDQVQDRLTPEELEQWAQAGVGLARNAFRAWEAAVEYFRVSPAVLAQLPFVQFLTWSEAGAELCAAAANIAVAYFAASPATLPLIEITRIPEWAAAGGKLYRQTWNSGLLAARLFEECPRLLFVASLDDLLALVELLATVALKSVDTARACLQLAVDVLDRLHPADRQRLLSLLTLIGTRTWSAVRPLFEESPDLLAHGDEAERAQLLDLAASVAPAQPEVAARLLRAVASVRADWPDAAAGRLLAQARIIARRHAGAAADFLQATPGLMRRLGPEALAQWVAIGLDVLRLNEDAGLSYFRYQSGRAAAVVEELSTGVSLESVRDLLRLYGQAITGRNLLMLPTGDLADKAIGWVSNEQPTTDGHAVFLPAYVDTWPAKPDNFVAYKVLAIHQLAHLEFRTFGFAFERQSTQFTDVRQIIERWKESFELSVLSLELANNEPQLRLQTSDFRLPPSPATDFERFFDLFRERRLARDVFALVEDTRIDATILREYRGIARAYRRMQESTLAERRPPETLPLRQALLEYLLRLAQSGGKLERVSEGSERLLSRLWRPLRRVMRPGATVEDAAEATIRLYAVLLSVPNVLLPTRDTRPVDFSAEADEEDAFQLSDLLAAEAGEVIEVGDVGEELAYESPDDSLLHGDLKPELVQTLMKVRKETGQQGAAEPISPEELLKLLEKSAEIELGELYLGNVDQSSGLFVNNLLKERGRFASPPQPTDANGPRPDASLEGAPPEPDPDDTRYFHYDEWDFRASDYRPRWCLVKEKTLDEGTLAFYDDTLTEHAGLSHEIRKQFEMLRPELFKKIKRLESGEDLDLDAALEAVVERKARVTPSEKIYWRRNKIERDVAVIFLLDMSASTDEDIKPGDEPSDIWVDDPQEYRNLRGWGPYEAPTRPQTKRIIDVEKESVVLLTRALEAIGDRYGIYGFSGYGRDNVELFVIKALREPFGDKIKRRIDKITPVRGTRMGAAIRHAIAQLEAEPARLRLLVLISDGRPQDHDYGKDRTEKDYALHDTRQALLEAQHKRIVPFCLTVDREGHDWLQKLSGDLGYEVVDDIEALPKRLPAIYRRLTT